VSRLIEKGLIAVETVANPVMKRMQPVVRPEELARFRKEYASLHVLAIERGVHHLRMKQDLAAAGVTPVADSSELQVSLYRRPDIP